eukprot:841781-Lingulodinium_polyedra.AAC.1
MALKPKTKTQTTTETLTNAKLQPKNARRGGRRSIRALNTQAAEVGAPRAAVCARTTAPDVERLVK